MNTTLFITTLQEYGVVVYKDDNEYGLVLDSGELTYVNKIYLMIRHDSPSGVRDRLWRVAWNAYRNVPEASEHYARVLRYWLTLAGEAGKTCSHCNLFLPYPDFYKSNETADGYRNQCKECYAFMNAARYKQRHEN